MMLAPEISNEQSPTSGETRSLVRRASNGDQRAWMLIVRRYQPLLYRVAARFDLSQAEREDVVQLTWQQAVEHLDSIRDGAALPGWLATCARRQCLAALRRHGHERLFWDLEEGSLLSEEPDVDDVVYAKQAAKALYQAIEQLPAQQRGVVTALLRSPASSYDEISKLLGIPVGSIGPTRARAVTRLSTMLEGLRPTG